MGGTYSRSKYDKTAYHEKFFFDLIPGDAASGKTVAVTGATANGLGIWLAKHAVLLGAKRVVLLNRASPRNAPALAEVIAFSKECGSTSTEILGVECDLLSFASVRNAAKQLNLICKHDGLDVLCLNAGTMAAPDENTDDGYNREVQVNFLAQHLLLKEVFPSLKKAAARTGDARVVQQSSGARMIPGKKGLVKAFFQKREQDSQNVSLPSGLRGDQKKGAGMLMLGPAWKRYGQTKLANSMSTEMYREQASRKEIAGVKFVTASPGLAASELQATTSCEFQSMKPWEANLVFFLAGQGVRDGSLPITQACFGPDVQSGDFYEPSKFTAYGLPRAISTGGVFKNPKADAGTISDDNTKQVMWELLADAFGGEVF